MTERLGTVLQECLQRSVVTSIARPIEHLLQLRDCVMHVRHAIVVTVESNRKWLLKLFQTSKLSGFHDGWPDFNIS